MASKADRRLQKQIERELADTMHLQQYGTLARAYGCTEHAVSLIDRRYCRKCWTRIA